MKEIPEYLRRDAGWRAALVILESDLFARSIAWTYVQPQTGDIWWKPMLKHGWSAGERAMLKAAASLYNPDYKVALWDLLATIDQSNAVVLQRAIAAFLGVYGSEL